MMPTTPCGGWRIQQPSDEIDPDVRLFCYSDASREAREGGGDAGDTATTCRTDPGSRGCRGKRDKGESAGTAS